MKQTFFQQKNRTQITAIMSGPTPESLIAQARGAEFDGADAIAVELNGVKPEFRNKESFKQIIGSVNLPFMFIFYRNDRWGVNPDDDARQEILLDAANAGAGMIDVMGDLYNPSPNECTRDQAAIEKQMRLIDRIHAAGSQVVISSHTGKFMRTEEVLEQLQSFEKRGPDVVKLVQTADTDEEFAELVKTTMLLRRELKTPFIHLCNGKFGRIHRFLGMTLGVSITFAVHRYETVQPFPQPTVTAMKTVVDNFHWHIDN